LPKNQQKEENDKYKKINNPASYPEDENNNYS
jgi:hypothetical protein